MNTLNLVITYNTIPKKVQEGIDGPFKPGKVRCPWQSCTQYKYTKKVQGEGATNARPPNPSTKGFSGRDIYNCPPPNLKHKGGAQPTPL